MITIVKTAKTAAAAARTVQGLLCLPTEPLMCEKCTAWCRWISPWQRATRVFTRTARCPCGGTLRPVSEVRLP